MNKANNKINHQGHDVIWYMSENKTTTLDKMDLARDFTSGAEILQQAVVYAVTWSHWCCSTSAFSINVVKVFTSVEPDQWFTIDIPNGYESPIVLFALLQRVVQISTVYFTISNGERSTIRFGQGSFIKGCGNVIRKTFAFGSDFVE